MMNIKLGNKKLRAEKVVQIYGSTGSGKTVLAGSIIKEYVEKHPNTSVVVIDVDYTSSLKEETHKKLEEVMSFLNESVSGVKKEILLLVDKVDWVEEGKVDFDSRAILIWDIITAAIKSPLCIGVVLTTQHVIPDFNLKRDLLIQTAMMRKKDTRYFAILQNPGETSYPLFDLTYKCQSDIKHIYNFLGYSHTGVIITSHIK